jgi:hypothetical protein
MTRMLSKSAGITFLCAASVTFFLSAPPVGAQESARASSFIALNEWPLRGRPFGVLCGDFWPAVAGGGATAGIGPISGIRQ